MALVDLGFSILVDKDSYIMSQQAAPLQNRKNRSFEDLTACLIESKDTENNTDHPRRKPRRIASTEDLATLARNPSLSEGVIQLIADLNTSPEGVIVGKNSITVPSSLLSARTNKADLNRPPTAAATTAVEEEPAAAPQAAVAAVPAIVDAPRPPLPPTHTAIEEQSSFYAAANKEPSPSPPDGKSPRSDTAGAPTIQKESMFHRMAQHPSVIYPPSAINTSPGTSGGNSPTNMSRSSTQSSLMDNGRRNSYELPRSSCDGKRSSLDNQAAEELFYRLNHARQTVDFVKRQASAFCTLSRAEMSIWEALDMLSTLREYESALLDDETLDSTMPQDEHAFQTAELCRLAFPELEWMPLVGLIHGLGKILAHSKFGAEPQWAIVGESFPVGCRHHPAVMHARYFSANPDRRKRAYTTPTGIYQPKCGLGNVCMSWSGAEYLYMVLARNKVLLPPEAMFIIRYQKFASMFRAGQPYHELLSAGDKSMLPMLEKFRGIAEYRRQEIPGRLEGEEFKEYYNALIKKYIPQVTLRW